MHQDSGTGPTDRLPALLVVGTWAGLLEEPILLGLTIRLALRLRWRWYVVLLVIAMRSAFHVPYGPGALFVSPWMCAAYAGRCPLLRAFIVGHGFDVLKTVTPHTGPRWSPT